MPWKQVKGVQRKVCLFLSETWFISHVFPGLELPCVFHSLYKSFYLRQEIWTPVQLARNCGGRCALSSKSEWLTFGWDVMDVDRFGSELCLKRGIPILCVHIWLPRCGLSHGFLAYYMLFHAGDIQIKLFGVKPSRGAIWITITTCNIMIMQ